MSYLSPCTHSVMFHHFHNKKHSYSQGSLSSYDFIEIIEWLNQNYKILSANEYLKKFKNNSIKNTDICLSFDDSLKCQFDIAIPILKLFKIKAFFFVYSSAFSNNPDPLEIYRYFRTSCFTNIDEFYDDFFEVVKSYNIQKYTDKYFNYKNLNYLSEFPFYSESDKWFRYLRDQYLNNDSYDSIMNDLMSKKDFDPKEAKKHLWMSEKELLEIDKDGHLIGLHSFSHPTQISKLSKAQQKEEYSKNYNHLSKLIGKPIDAMSHPCGDYNEITLGILSSMNIEIGFRSNMSITNIPSSLEIPREDHSNVLKKIRNASNNF